MQARRALHGRLAVAQGQVDVLILCGGSKDDLPRQAPELAAHFNLVDSFDTHARIPNTLPMWTRPLRGQHGPDLGRLGPRHVLHQPRAG
jgi:hypothetical protein